MHGIVEQVLAWHARGLPVALVRAVAMSGTSANWSDQVLAVTPGAPPAGSFLLGALDPELTRLGEQAVAARHSGSVLDIGLARASALAAGLVCEGSVRVLVHPSSDVPDAAWSALAAGEPICLVTDLERHNLGRTSWFTLESLASTGIAGQRSSGRHSRDVVALFGRGHTRTTVLRLSGPPALDASSPRCGRRRRCSWPGAACWLKH